jgi:hypothetical protein
MNVKNRDIFFSFIKCHVRLTQLHARYEGVSIGVIINRFCITTRSLVRTK